MVNPGLSVKGLPKGWKILQMSRSTIHPQDAVVLCERTPQHPEQNDCGFVTWAANLQMGGVFHGHYFNDKKEAEADFTKRRVNLR